ncbi:MAG: NAD(P)/FAD-dependent oxidoreductase [Gammaproteobacteria bacterium]|nr:NAD(P)/FAD-dependent oxidoreductase [Gammaproteobacteria bacterium]MCP5459947.1 NAD(P)/FAD-dependent oxidoreductase [Gammaproteobacteria bacterium]
MQYAIIGAGPAGVIAAETLRKTDPQGSIVLIGGEPEPPYSRMAIPYLLIERIPETGTYLRHSPDHFQKQGIEIRQDRVTAMDTPNRRLTLSSGDGLQYDRLLIATGSRPIKLPVPGIDLPGVHNCWTLEDARHILRLAQPGAKVVLIGAGFIGCIILEALAERGVDLSVVEMGDRMVPRMMNQTAGNLIKRWCEAKGIQVHTATRVKGIESRSGPGFLKRVTGVLGLDAESGSANALGVELDNGHRLQADLVISATGVQPNSEFLKGSSVELEQGILVDNRLRTNIPEIFAAGDVAQGRDFSTGGHQVHAIQPTASDHGRVAALNMAGTDTLFQGSFNMNVLDTLGLISSSFGLWMGVEGGDSVEICSPEKYRYLNLEFQEDVMVGATSLGLTQHVGVLRGLIQGRVKLGQWKDRLKRDPSRLMEAYLAQNAVL